MAFTDNDLQELKELSKEDGMTVFNLPSLIERLEAAERVVEHVTLCNWTASDWNENGDLSIECDCGEFPKRIETWSLSRRRRVDPKDQPI